MLSTTVHFPPPLLGQIDAVAQRRGVSRNRFVMRACQDAIAKDAGEWPEHFFHLDLDPVPARSIAAPACRPPVTLGDDPTRSGPDRTTPQIKNHRRRCRPFRLPAHANHHPLSACARVHGGNG